MGTDSTLVGAAFKYGASKAKADVPDLTPLSKGQVDISKSYVKGVTDVFANMKKKREALEATKNAQLRAFKQTAARARAHLLEEEQSQPMKVHDAIYDKFKSLEDEFKLYNTTGDNDTEQNEKMRANLYAQLQMITSQAVKSRGTIATAATMADDLLVKPMSISNIEVAKAIMGVDGNYDNIELSFNEKGQLLYHVGLADGSIHKWTIDDFNKNVHIHDVAIDAYSAKRERQLYDLGYKTGKTLTDKDKASEHKGFLTTVVGNDEKKLVDAMYSDLNGRKSWVDSLYDGEDSYNIATVAIEHLFEEDMVGKIGLVDVDGKSGITIDDMDTDGKDGITAADLQGLTDLQKGYWEMNIEKIISALTKLDDPGFNFERSSNALADYFVNGLEGHFNDGRGDKGPEGGGEGNYIINKQQITPDTFNRNYKPHVDILNNNTETGGWRTTPNGTMYKKDANGWHMINKDTGEPESSTRSKVAINIGFDKSHGLNFGTISSTGDPNLSNVEASEVEKRVNMAVTSPTIIGTDIGTLVFSKSQTAGAAEFNTKFKDYENIIKFQATGKRGRDKVEIVAQNDHDTPGEVLYTLEFDYDKVKERENEMEKFNEWLAKQEWYKFIPVFNPDEE